MTTPRSQQNKTYRIGELAAEFGVTLRALRFYEDKGLLSPTRIGRTRVYSCKDRVRLKLITLGKRVGLSLFDIKRLIEMYDPEDNRRQLSAALKIGEIRLAVLQNERDQIDKSIAELAELLTQLRNELTG
ncbi:MerR family transcriptional regulator [Oricola indica]|jgi:DNA-binding transcriptional MerR regulator|uniref:MerR family transcriptional regulator n=1 Tax=Oricola indica TaxID=2872591 RepID=UPI003CCC320F